MQKPLAVLAILLLLLAGCARPSGKEFRQIVYSYTGGIAGFDRSVVVTSDGTYQTAERGRPGKSGQLSAAELRDLRDLTSRVHWESVEEQYIDPKVADAIHESVTVTVGKKSYRTLVGTGGQPPADLAALLGKLKQILEAHK